MPFQTACPFCPTRFNRVPDRLLAASIRCPQCGNYFTAAPDERSAPERPGARRTDAILQPMAVDGTVSVAPALTPAGPMCSVTETSSMSCEQTASSTPLTTALATPTDSPAAAPRATPAAASTTLGLPASGARSDAARLVKRSRYPGGRDTRPLVWLGLAGAACLVALLIGFGGRLTRTGAPQLPLPDPDPHGILIVTPDNRQVVNDLGREEWADAATAALRQGNVYVRIVSVKMDEDEPRPQQPIADADRLPAVLILVRIAGGHGMAPPAYQGLCNSTPSPTLRDERGRGYRLRRDAAKAPKAAHARGGRSGKDASGKAVEELLIFESVAADFESLKLELPAAGWAGSGTWRFRIPRGLISFPPPAAAATSAPRQP